MFQKIIVTYLYLTFCLNKKLQKFKTENNPEVSGLRL